MRVLRLQKKPLTLTLSQWERGKKVSINITLTIYWLEQGRKLAGRV